MSDPADVGFLLGYGSFCEIGLRYGTEAGSLAGGEASETVRVPLLNASYDRARNVPTQGIFNTQLNESKGGRFRTARRRAVPPRPVPRHRRRAAEDVPRHDYMSREASWLSKDN